MANPDPTQTHQGPVLSTTEARQGRRGRHAMWILGISLGLIVAIYAVMVIGVQGTHLNQPGGQTTVDQKSLEQAGGYQAVLPQARQTEQSPTVSAGVKPSAGKEQTPRTTD